MSSAGAFDATPAESKPQLVEWFEKGCKPPVDWRIGTEHEKFGFRLADHAPLPYDGDGPTVRKMLEGMTRFDWEPVDENGHVIGLKRGAATIALEPGGQFELSGAPLENLHQTCGEVNQHLKEVKAVADDIGAGFLGLGFAPTWRLDEMPVMPKARYAIMRGYMPKVGRLGREMMFRTCTIQVNLDFASEADMAKKLRVGLALQPVATALFANGPFAEGRVAGWKSLRAFAWSDTDNDRTGMLPPAFDEGFGFEQYADWALDVPMYFLRRDGESKDATGFTFRDLFDGRGPAWAGAATMGDWEDHLSTLFPEARIKRFLEMRGADGGPWARICALPAFWVGLLYDSAALDAAFDLVRDWTAVECEALRLGAAKLGLAAPFRGRTLGDLANDALALSHAGLKRRGRANLHGEPESVFLQDLEEIAASGRTPADVLLDRLKDEWGGDLDRIFAACAY